MTAAPTIHNAGPDESQAARDVLRRVLDAGIRATSVALGDKTTLGIKALAVKMLIEDLCAIDPDAAYRLVSADLSEAFRWPGAGGHAPTPGSSLVSLRVESADAFAALARAEHARRAASPEPVEGREGDAP